MFQILVIQKMNHVNSVAVAMQTLMFENQAQASAAIRSLEDQCGLDPLFDYVKLY